MATKQKNFKDLNTTRKGAIGERVVKEMLENAGWVVYLPVTEKAHAFDMLAIKDKHKVKAIEVKTKARLNNWAAQGIDIRHYEEYMKISHVMCIDLWLFFVDDKNGSVHAQNLRKLPEPFVVNENIVAWYLSDMQHMATINDRTFFEQCNKLDSRNYAYLPIT